MSTPGDDKPDPLDLSEFDLPTDEGSTVEDGLLSDLPGEAELSLPGEPLSDLFGESLSADAPLEEAAPADLPLEEALPAEAGEGGMDMGGFEGLPAFDADSPLGKPAEADDGKKKKKKKKAPKAKKEKKEGDEDAEGLVQRLLKASPFVVILALSLLALLIATILLIVELARFEYDIKAQDVKQRAALTAPPHSLPPRTTATA